MSKYMKAVGPGLMAIGSTLLTIGYIKDSSIGQFPFKTFEDTLTTSPDFDNFTVKDIRKTDGTAYTLKLIGVITLASGAIFEFVTTVLYDDESKPVYVNEKSPIPQIQRRQSAPESI